MSLPTSRGVPPGWYPDPGGARQWRVWTGTTWSELTRPYGAPVLEVPLSSSLGLVNSLHRLTRYGVVALYAGIGLIVSMLAHWPGTHQPTPLWFAEIGTDAGVALVLVGTVLYAATLRELEGCWTYRCFIPGVNALVATALITERLSKNSTWWRALSQGALLAIYMVNAHAEPWLCVAPLIVALDQMQWATNLIDKLCAPSSTAPASAP